MSKILDFIKSAMVGTAVQKSKTVPKAGEKWKITRKKGLWMYDIPSKKGKHLMRLDCGTVFTVHDVKVGNTSCFAKLKRNDKWGWVLIYDSNGTYCKLKSKPAPVPPTPTKTKQEKAVDYAKKIAKDNSYHYVVWNPSDPKTKECPICHKLTGKDKGFNCIRFVFTCLHHAGIPFNHEGGLINNDIGNKMYRVSIKEATKMAQKALGCKSLKVIRNKKGIPRSKMQIGDACMIFSGGIYKHMYLYAGNGKMVDCGRYGSDAKEIDVRNAQPCQMLIRYTGK